MAEMNNPIGIFDSGIGGMTVTRAVRSLLPGEDIIYYGDTARVPYGPKSSETIRRFSSQIARFLVSRGVKLIVVACNSASSSSLELLQQTMPVKVVGVIGPGAKAAVRISRIRRVAVIGTKATVASGAYERALEELSPGFSAVSQPCPLLVPFVEEGWMDTIETRLVIKRYLSPILRHGIDAIILGCTHYPLLKTTISEIIGPGIALIDSADETALEVRNLLDDAGMLKPIGTEPGRLDCFVSDSTDAFRESCLTLFGEVPASVEQVKVWETGAVPHDY